MKNIIESGEPLEKARGCLASDCYQNSPAGKRAGLAAEELVHLQEERARRHLRAAKRDGFVDENSTTFTKI